MEYCKKCLMPDTRPGLKFHDGICYACIHYEKQKDLLARGHNEAMAKIDEHNPRRTHLGKPAHYERTPPENAEIIEDYIPKPPKPTKPPIKDDYIKVKKPEEIDICENIPLGGHYAWQNCEKIRLL